MEERKKLKKKLCERQSDMLGGRRCEMLRNDECGRASLSCEVTPGGFCRTKVPDPCELFSRSMPSCVDMRGTALATGLEEEWKALCEEEFNKSTFTRRVASAAAKGASSAYEYLAAAMPNLVELCMKLITSVLKNVGGFSLNVIRSLVKFYFKHPECFSNMLNELICKGPPEDTEDWVVWGKTLKKGQKHDRVEWLDGAMKYLCDLLTYVLCFVKDRVLPIIPGGQWYNLRTNLRQGACANLPLSVILRNTRRMESMWERMNYDQMMADATGMFSWSLGFVSKNVGRALTAAKVASAVGASTGVGAVASAGTATTAALGSVAMAKASVVLAVAGAAAVVGGSIFNIAYSVEIENPYGCKKSIWLELAQDMSGNFVSETPAWIKDLTGQVKKEEDEFAGEIAEMNTEANKEYASIGDKDLKKLLANIDKIKIEQVVTKPAKKKKK